MTWFWRHFDHEHLPDTVTGKQTDWNGETCRRCRCFIRFDELSFSWQRP